MTSVSGARDSKSLSARRRAGIAYIWAPGPRGKGVHSKTSAGSRPRLAYRDLSPPESASSGSRRTRSLQHQRMRVTAKSFRTMVSAAYGFQPLYGPLRYLKRIRFQRFTPDSSGPNGVERNLTKV